MRSPGDRPPTGRPTCVGTEPELGQQGAGVGHGQAGRGQEAVEQRPRRIEPAAGLVELADHDRRPEPASARRQPARRPAVRRSSVVLPLPLAPTMARRSAQSTWRSTGPSWNEPRSTTAPSSRATTLPLRGASASSRRSSQPSHGLSTRSSRSSTRSVRLASAERPSALAMRPPADELVVVARVLHRPAHAGPRPRPLPAGPLMQVPAPLVGTTVGLLGVAPSHRPLLLVGEPAAVEPRRPTVVLVQLDHARHHPFEEGPVVAHQRDARVEPGDETLEALQAVEVQVVGRFVEEEDVEPAQQDRRQLDPGRLPTGQRHHRLHEQRCRRARGRPTRLRHGPRGRHHRARASARGPWRTGRRLRHRRRPTRTRRRRARRWPRSRPSGAPAGRTPSRRAGARAPGAGSRRSPSPAPTAPRRGRGRAGRRAPAAASSCRRRSARRSRSGAQARRSGRRRRGSWWHHG